MLLEVREPNKADKRYSRVMYSSSNVCKEHVILPPNNGLGSSVLTSRRPDSDVACSARFEGVEETFDVCTVSIRLL